MRSLIVAFCLAALPTFAAADLASEGRDCYHAGDIVCTTDKLLAHGVVAWSMKRSERALPETDFMRCVQNWACQVRSSG